MRAVDGHFFDVELHQRNFSKVDFRTQATHRKQRVGIGRDAVAAESRRNYFEVVDFDRRFRERLPYSQFDATNRHLRIDEIVVGKAFGERCKSFRRKNPDHEA